MRKFKKYLRPILLALVVTAILCVPAFATSGGKGNVGAVVESTWKDHRFLRESGHELL